MNINPLADRVIVRPVDRSETVKGGIIIPDTAKEKPQEGEVVAVGKGRLTEKGERVKPEVKKGDKVLFRKYSGTEINIDDEKYLILQESEILATL
ncbi:MAG: co-chaperone GroES [Candidatus Latescibacterota bacterium]|nr:MAG: co-chaperone GroES [Candidatus Latescibacterota bacterium]